MRSVFLTLLLSHVSLPWLPSLPAPVSPWLSGGGKARVFAKLMICPCAKLTGGWTSTQTPLMASRPLCWHPRSPALGPCRLQPLPTPMPAALAPQSMPESLPTFPQGPKDLRDKIWWSPLGSLCSALVSAWGLLWPPWEPHRHRDSPPRSTRGK